MTLRVSLTRNWCSRVLVAILAGSMLLGVAYANEDLIKLQQDPGQWVMPNQNYAGWNYSPIDQINTQNVQNLTLAWTFPTGVTDSHESQPLVIGDTMYIVTPKPNTVYALDLKQNGVIKWSFAADMPNLDIAIERACCGAQTRGLAYIDGKLFFNSLDGKVFALNANTGEVLWERQNADLTIAETMSTVPLVVKNNLVVGVMGGEFGVRGHVTAYDLNTGERKWRFYSMGPDEEIGVGPRFKPFYADDKVENPGVATWYKDSWKRGGGTIWGWFTYDPELNMFYYSTGNCGPWNPDLRRDPATAPGLDVYSNKYCASLLARDGDTGELIWAYSLTPQDQWDLDEPGVNPLIDLEIDGQQRKALVKPARNGFFYVFDRATGELLKKPWKFTTVTWAHGVDMKTGRPNFDMDRIMYTDKPVKNVCPRIAARNWENDAYSPRTGLYYFTAQNKCMDYMVVEGEYIPGAAYRLREYLDRYNGPGNWQAELQAWDPAQGKKVWGLKYPNADNTNPILATAGDLLFQGTDKGALRALDAQTGKELWSFRANTGFNASPISYIGPDGKAYIAVIASQEPSEEVITVDAPPDEEARYSRAGSTLYVFALPSNTAETGGD